MMSTEKQNEVDNINNEDIKISIKEEPVSQDYFLNSGILPSLDKQEKNLFHEDLNVQNYLIKKYVNKIDTKPEILDTLKVCTSNDYFEKNDIIEVLDAQNESPFEPDPSTRQLRLFRWLGLRQVRYFAENCTSFCEENLSRRTENTRNLVSYQDKDVCAKNFLEVDIEKLSKKVENWKKILCCSICDKIFSNRSSLNKHLIIHSGERPFKCDFCSKTFNQNCNLKTHMLIHTGERRYKCKLCGKAFVQSGGLHMHSLVHSGEKPFECGICGKSFTQLSTIKAHVRIHTGERPFACNLCGKRFNQHGNLKKHSLIHTPNKPLKCECCEKKFRYKTNLKRHMVLHHNEKKLDGIHL